MLEADESQGSTQSCPALIEQGDYQLSYFMLAQALSDDLEFFLSSKLLKGCPFAWLTSQKPGSQHTHRHVPLVPGCFLLSWEMVGGTELA